ncbi:hypothetical protein WG908_13215 [Sphingobium sp. AN641]|uniref:hypothetical protein n=1 Tax=Sphingobium sp. AN641 TaxID=3133443 RepID=UPI0030BEFAD0
MSLEPTVNAREDYTHFAFDVEEEGFCQLKELIVRHAIVWKDDVSEGHSLYFLDPDGHKLELHIGTLNTRLAHYARAGMNVSIFE